jgi:adenosylhomocysteine nucleosidase
MTQAWPSGSERIGVVTGLEAEVHIARRVGWRVAVGGGTAAGARAAALGLVEQGATALVSFGLAGGLDPALVPGALVVPEAVWAAGVRLATDAALSGVLGGPTPHDLLGAETLAATADDKRRLWTETGCAAIDLESGPVAEVAHARGLRFAALRAVCDPANVDLPPAALVALSAHGRIGVVRVLASVALSPDKIPALLRLARAAGRARGALVHGVGMAQAQIRGSEG